MLEKILKVIKKMFEFINYLTKSKYYDDLNKPIPSKMNDGNR